MSDLCVNPKETVYFYIKDQSTLQKTGKGNNITLFYIIYQAPVVQTLDSAIHRINHYPADKYKGNQLHYPLDRD